jgi:uncharacterized protein (DUF488 family)
MNAIWTVGHGTAPLSTLRAILDNAGISLLVDVRTSPRSRWNPQYNRTELDAALPMWGIRYEWKGRNLGGLGENVDFEETVSDVAQEALRTRTALMCSESNPEKCHRRLLLAPAFQAHGLKVVHLLHDGTSTTEPPTSPPLF